MRTRFTLRELRAEQLHQVLSEPDAQFLTLEDIHQLAAVRGWHPAQRAVAICDLVDAGILVDDAYGRCYVAPRPGPVGGDAS